MCTWFHHKNRIGGYEGPSIWWLHKGLSVGLEGSALGIGREELELSHSAGSQSPGEEVMKKDRGQRSEDKRQKKEDRGQKTENIGHHQLI